MASHLDVHIDRLAESRRERLQSAPRPAGVSGQSSLAFELMLLVAWGHMYPATAARLARAQVADDAHRNVQSMPEVAKLANAGSDGKYVGNIRRDFLSAI